MLNNIFDTMKSTSTSTSASFFNKKSSNESEMSLNNRMKLIASALIMYSDWFDLEGDALPDDFYKLAGYPKPPKPSNNKNSSSQNSHQNMDDSLNSEFSSQSPPSSSLNNEMLSSSTPPPSLNNNNLITEEEFAEYKPNIEIVDV